MQGTFVSNNDELEKNKCVEILQKTNAGFYERMSVFSERLAKREFNARVSELVELGIRRYQDIYSNPDRKRGAFVLYEKYSRRDVCLLLNWGRDLSSTMYGMKRIGDDVAIFVTYNKGEAGEEKQYLVGKPDYADEFIDNQTFLWDSQIGKGPESSYMKDVQEAKNKHLFIKKSDAEGTDFYYMGQFDIIDIRADKKMDNNGKLKDISKVRFKMHDSVRDDLLEYLRRNERLS